MTPLMLRNLTQSEVVVQLLEEGKLRTLFLQPDMEYPIPGEAVTSMLRLQVQRREVKLTPMPQGERVPPMLSTSNLGLAVGVKSKGVQDILEQSDTIVPVP